MAPDSTAPLLSACLIVRDEEELLPACLASLQGLADEVVVSDTGSRDATMEIARAAGAMVHEGYWDDDFARARNAALSQCRGRWVLHVDADEVVQGDLAGLREDLRRERSDVVSVAIDNVAGPARSVRSTHRGGRLFQRSRGRWAGRLHEQVVAASGAGDLTEATTERIRLVHVGYAGGGEGGRAKLERNVRLAQAQMAAAGGADPAIALNLARSLVAADRVEEGFEHLRSLRGVGVANPVVRRRVLRSGAECLLALGRPREALAWLDELRRDSSVHGIVDYLEATAHLQLGAVERALSCLDAIDEPRDEDGNEVPGALVAARRGLALFAEKRWREAIDVLLPVVALVSEHEPAWAALVEAAHQVDAAAEVAAAVTPDLLVVALGQALTRPVEAADAFGEALWQAGAAPRALVPFGATIGVDLGLDRALEWSARARQHGAPDHCPLLAIAGAPAEDPERRIMAGAIAVGAFADEGALGAIADAAALVAAGRFDALLHELDQIAPAALPSFVRGAASTPARCRLMADALEALGAAEQAAELRELAAALERSSSRP
ncbi:MAG: glycosyltransferase family 2 protein [Acidimicrobiales bacterium]